MDRSERSWSIDELMPFNVDPSWLAPWSLDDLAEEAITDFISAKETLKLEPPWATINSKEFSGIFFVKSDILLLVAMN